MWPIFFQDVSWPHFRCACSGDKDCGLSCFRMWVGLVLTCTSSNTDCDLVSGCELAWFLMCTILVTQTVAYLVSVGELSWFVMCTLLVTQGWPVLFQEVRWPCFWCALFWWHRCGLSCFRMWVSLVFLMCTLVVTQTVACLLSVGELAWFSMLTLLMLLCLVSVGELA